jgi:hypothetical protein
LGKVLPGIELSGDADAIEAGPVANVIDQGIRIARADGSGAAVRRGLVHCECPVGIVDLLMAASAGSE